MFANSQKLVRGPSMLFKSQFPEMIQFSFNIEFWVKVNELSSGHLFRVYAENEEYIEATINQKGKFILSFNQDFKHIPTLIRLEKQRWTLISITVTVGLKKILVHIGRNQVVVETYSWNSLPKHQEIKSYQIHLGAPKGFIGKVNSFLVRTPSSFKFGKDNLNKQS